MRSPDFRFRSYRLAEPRPIIRGRRVTPPAMHAELHLPPFARCPMLYGKRAANRDEAARSGQGMRFIERLSADATSLRGALRTLRMTTPIARHPTRVFPQVIAELAGTYGDAPALLSDRERFSYRELAARANRYARWALAQGLAQGRHRLPADAEPAGVHGGLARRHPDRRRRGAAQHQSHRRTRWRTASTRSSRSTSSSAPDLLRRSGQRARPGRRRRQDLAAWRRRRAVAAHRSRRRRPVGRADLTAAERCRRSPSRIARSTSTPPAPPACRRPPTSTTTG